MTVRCSSCNADIFFARTPTGKRIPIDLLPNEKGNLVIRRVQGVAVAVPLAKAGELVPGEVKHVSHFATCPNAPAHRSPR